MAVTFMRSARPSVKNQNKKTSAASVPPRNSRGAKPGAPAAPPRQALALSVLEEFRLIFKSVRSHFQWVEAQTGVSGAQLWVLAEVAGAPGIRVTALARALSLHQSTISNLVERLEERKLLRRTRAADDQRGVLLHLTAAGKRLVARAPQPLKGILPNALERLSAEDLALLKQQLRQVTAAMTSLDKRGRKTHLSDA